MAATTALVQALGVTCISLPGTGGAEGLHLDLVGVELSST